MIFWKQIRQPQLVANHSVILINNYKKTTLDVNGKLNLRSVPDDNNNDVDHGNHESERGREWERAQARERVRERESEENGEIRRVLTDPSFAGLEFSLSR